MGGCFSSAQISGLPTTTNTTNSTSKNKEIKPKQYIWIDSNFDNNLILYHDIFHENTKLKCIRFKSVEEAITHILTYTKNKKDENNIINIKVDNNPDNGNIIFDYYYKDVSIIISGSLYFDFYAKFNEKLMEINFVPTIIVYLSEKDYFIENLKLNGLFNDNNRLLDRDLIFNNGKELKKYIDSQKIETKKELSFELVDNYEQLAIPFYYTQFFEDTTDTEIFLFNKYMDQKYKNENNLYELISQVFDKNPPNNILCKYWLRMFTCPSKFHKDMNEDLRKESRNITTYYPFIKMCYEGVRKEYITPCVNEKLYRGQILLKNEYDSIIKLYKKKAGNHNFPKLLIYSKCFLSFSKDPDVAEFFAKDSLTGHINEIPTIFIIEKDDNTIINPKILSNADLDDISKIPTEKEILFFPLSCFEINKIEDDNDNINNNTIIKYKYIYLSYLGRYGDLLKNQLNSYEVVNNTQFSNFLVNTRTIPADFLSPIWLNNGELSIKITNICFVLDNFKDLVGYNKNIIYVLTLKGKIKQEIKVHIDEILCIIKLREGKICSCSKDKTIKILQLYDNNKKYNEIKIINLKENYSKKILYLNNNNILIIKNNNSIDSYNLNYDQHKKNFLFEIYKIINMIEISNNAYALILENNNNKKFLKIMSGEKKRRKRN